MPRVLIAGCGYVGSGRGESFSRSGMGGRRVDRFQRNPRRNSPHKPYPVRAVDISNRRSSARPLPADLMWSSIVRARAEATRKIIVAIYLDGARKPSSLLFSKRDFFSPAARAFTRKQTARGCDESSPAEPTHETGKILRETEEIVLRRRNRRAPGRNLWTGPLVLAAKISRGEAVIDRETIVSSIRRTGTTSRQRCFCWRCQSSGSRSARSYNVVDDQPDLASECYAVACARASVARCHRMGKAAAAAQTRRQ